MAHENFLRGPTLHGCRDTDELRPADEIRAELESLSELSHTGCIEWQGFTEKGYGRITVAYRINDAGRRVHVKRFTHRVTWELERGPLPYGMCLDHIKCNNRCCRNTQHLKVATLAANSARGRLETPRVTQCIRGHARTADNTYIDARGYTSCKICRRVNFLRFHERKQLRQQQTADAE